MRPQPITIHLGGEHWQVRPLTLGQIQRIEPLLMPETQRAGSLAAATEIVAVALSRDHAEVSKKLHEVEATTGEIAAAMRAVLRFAGFIASDATEASPGEAQAGVDPISH
jgi:hypothetical protein